MGNAPGWFQKRINDEVDRRAESQLMAHELWYRGFLLERYPVMTYTSEKEQVQLEINNIVARFGPESADWIIEASKAVKQRLQERLPNENSSD